MSWRTCAPVLAALAACAAPAGQGPPEVESRGERPAAQADPPPAPEPQRPREPLAALDEPRPEKRARLAREAATFPGWRFTESAHYFVLTDVPDDAFVSELLERLEALRLRYREDFPHPQADPVPVRTSPLVLRLLASAGGYHEYGGPGGSTGYWSSSLGELVMYDEAAGGARRDTLHTLQSLAFRAWLDEAYGGLPFEPWYEHGHAGWCASWRYVDGRYEPGAGFDEPPPLAGAACGRCAHDRELVLRSLERGGTVPLRGLVRLTREGFLGANPWHASPNLLAAQATLLVRFLREEAAAVEPRWAEILPRYLEAMLASGDPAVARAAAFDGVDLEQLEAVWRAWIEG